MFTAKLEKELNKQLNREFLSAYLYISMAAYFQSVNLSGFEHWMKVQAKEELSHAQKIYNFIHERNGKVTLEQIDKPQITWESPLLAFEDSLNHEKHITECINELINLAAEEKDHATSIFLQWFVTEQVEEEAGATEIIKKLKFIKDMPGGLLMLDKELGKRA
jgi:ferritin